MSNRKHVLGISGSLRAASLNTVFYGLCLYFIPWELHLKYMSPGQNPLL